MRDLTALKHAASNAARYRGHSLRWVAPWHGERKSTQQATCRYKACGMEVQINTRPEPNEIDIGGEAVALNCPRERA